MIDIDTETGLARAHSRNRQTGDIETRMDEQEISFHKRVRNAYHQLASDEPDRVKLIDGSGDEDGVAEQVWRIVQPAAGISS